MEKNIIIPSRLFFIYYKTWGRIFKWFRVIKRIKTSQNFQRLFFGRRNDFWSRTWLFFPHKNIRNILKFYIKWSRNDSSIRWLTENWSVIYEASSLWVFSAFLSFINHSKLNISLFYDFSVTLKTMNHKWINKIKSIMK